MKHKPIKTTCHDWLVVALLTASLFFLSTDSEAELMLELSAGYSYPTDSLGDDEVGDQPLATLEAGWNHKGYGISYLHISNPTARDYGVNMLRIKKRFTW